MAKNNQFSIEIGIDINDKQAFIKIEKLIDKLQNKIDRDLKLKLFKEKDIQDAKSDLEKLEKSVKDTGDEFKKASKDVNKFNKEAKKTKKNVNDTTKATSKAKDTTNKYSNSLVNAFSKFSIWAGIGAIIYKIADAFASVMRNIVELDSSFTELVIVTEASNEQLEQVDSTVTRMGGSLGALKSEIVTTVQEFARAGYEIQQSMQLAESAILGTNIGFTTLDKTSRTLIASLKAFQMEAAESDRIVNSLFVTSREGAVTFEGLGEAILRSGNSLSNAKVQYEEALGLITAANEAVQDPAKVGSALKTIAARLRGVDSANNLPKLEESLRQIGVEIREGENEFRNMYDILSDISEAFKTMDNEMMKQRILEELAGKRRANILTGLLANFEQAKNVVKETNDQVNAAQDANEVYVESIDGILKRIKSGWEDFSDAVVSSDMVKTTLKGIADELERINYEINLDRDLEGLKSDLETMGIDFNAVFDGSTRGMLYLSESLDSLTVGFMSTYDSAEEFYNQQEKLSKQIEEMSDDDLVDFRDRLQKLQLTYEANNNGLNQAKGVLESYKKELSELDRTDQAGIDKIKDKIDSQNKSIEIYRKNIENATLELLKLGIVPDKVGSHIDNLNNKIDDFTESTAGMGTAIQEALDKQNQALETNSAKYQIWAENFEMLTEGQKELMKDMLDSDIERTEKMIDNAKVRLQAYTEELNGFRTLLQGYRNEVDNAMGIDELRTEKQIQKTQEFLESDLFKSRVGEGYKEASDNLENLKNQLKGLQEDRKEYFGDLKDSGSGSGSSSDEKTALEKQIETIQKQIKLAETELKGLEIIEAPTDKRVAKFEEIIKIQKEYRELLKQRREEVKAGSDEYIDLSTAIAQSTNSIEDNYNAIEDLNKASKELIENNKKLVDQYEDEFKEAFDKLKDEYEDDFEEFEKQQQNKIEAVEKAMEELERERDTDEFKDEEEELLDNIANLEEEYNRWRIDNSTRASYERFKIEKELEEERERLTELRADREYELEKQSLEDKKSLLEEELDEEEEAYNQKLEELEGYISEATEIINESKDRWAESGMTLGEAMKNGLLEGLGDTLDKIQEVTGMDMQSFYDEVTGETKKYADRQQMENGSVIDIEAPDTSTSEKEAMSEEDRRMIENAQSMWWKIDEREKAGTIDGERAVQLKKQYHALAERIRNKYGFSGGTAGDKYIPLNSSQTTQDILKSGDFSDPVTMNEAQDLDKLVRSLEQQGTNVTIQSLLSMEGTTINGKEYDSIDEFSKDLADSLRSSGVVAGLGKM